MYGWRVAQISWVMSLVTAQVGYQSRGSEVPPKAAGQSRPVICTLSRSAVRFGPVNPAMRPRPQASIHAVPTRGTHRHLQTCAPARCARGTWKQGSPLARDAVLSHEGLGWTPSDVDRRTRLRSSYDSEHYFVPLGAVGVNSARVERAFLPLKG